MTRSPAADPDLELRPYAVAGGRTRLPVDWVSVQYVQALIVPTDDLDDEYAELLHLTASPISVVEVCARSTLPAMVTALLLADLIAAGGIRVSGQIDYTTHDYVSTLEKVLVGLRNL